MGQWQERYKVAFLLVVVLAAIGAVVLIQAIRIPSEPFVLSTAPPPRFPA